MAIMNVTKNVKNQFSNDKNLAMRINFYKKYTTNKYKFADWLFDKYVFKKNMKILELGCGNGSHWDDKIETLPNGCSLVLSDFSEGMLDLVRKKFSTSENVSIKKIDIQEIPFEDETFDKIKELDNYERESKYTVKRGDIDVNHHMHNINYLDLANEALPDEVYDNEKEFNNFKISYKKEIKLGETVKCKYSFVNNTHVICVKSEDDTKLHSVIEFLES